MFMYDTLYIYDGLCQLVFSYFVVMYVSGCIIMRMNLTYFYDYTSTFLKVFNKSHSIYSFFNKYK